MVRAGLARLGGLGLLEVPAEGVGVPLEGELAVAEVAAAELEGGFVLVVAAVEAHGAVDDAGLGGAAHDVVDGVGVGRGAGALAMVVDEEDGGLVVEREALERGHGLGHLLLVHLVAAAEDAAEGVDDHHVGAVAVHGRAQVGHAVVAEIGPGGDDGDVAVLDGVIAAYGTLEEGSEVDAHAPGQLAQAVGDAVGGVFERQVEDLEARHGEAEKGGARGRRRG